MADLLIPTIKAVRVGRDGPNVVVYDAQTGQTYFNMPWEAARDLGKAIRLQAARAEQTAKQPQVIADQALLIRKGIPLSLTPNPEVFAEAGKEAAHDRNLRRYLPGGVPSGVKFGMPRLFGRRPKAEDGNGNRPA